MLIGVAKSRPSDEIRYSKMREEEIYRDIKGAGSEVIKMERKSVYVHLYRPA